LDIAPAVGSYGLGLGVNLNVVNVLKPTMDKITVAQGEWKTK